MTRELESSPYLGVWGVGGDRGGEREKEEGEWRGGLASEVDEDKGN